MNLKFIDKRLEDLSKMIGNTPLIEISFKYKGFLRKIYCKAEYYNLTGSAKDRMAFHILKKAYDCGKLNPNDLIAEATSGNTGISFCALGTALGHRVLVFMPEWMSDERKNLIRSFGADIKLVSKEEGGFLGCIRMAEELAQKNENIFLPRQFSNEDNCEAHYLTTGPEIFSQLQNIGITPDAVVAGVGTGGSIMGIGRYLKAKNPKIKVHPLEPENSPTMSTGDKFSHHRIQGISDEFIPPIVKLNELDEIISVDDGDAIRMAQKIASVLGIGIGISSGANFLGAVKAQDMLDNKGNVVTLFVDDNKKYLSTDLMRYEPSKKSYISNDIELISFKAYR